MRGPGCEATQLDTYFLETEQFRLTLTGDLNIILGRKGSGKTAIFLQARNKVRANKNNIVVDLAPEGFQLIKLKELRARPQIIESTFDRVRYGVYNQAEYRMLWG